MANATCSIDGCEKPREARGWCIMHYRRWQTHGDANRVDRPGRRAGSAGSPGPIEPFAVTLTRAEVVPSGCWLWRRGLSKKGYAHITVAGQKWAAHRYFYTQMVGPIPEGLVLDHLCRVRNCVNPQHLEPVTALENLARGIGPNAKAIRDDTCNRGHAFTPENTMVRPDRNTRRCRACLQIDRAKAREKKRLAG